MRNFLFYKQKGITDCGPACLKMIAHYYGIRVSIARLNKLCQLQKRKGTSIDKLSKAAYRVGLNSLCVSLKVSDLKRVPLPALLFYWPQKPQTKAGHYSVLYSIKENCFLIADPLYMIVDPKKKWYKKSEVADKLLGLRKTNKGVVVLFEPRSKAITN